MGLDATETGVERLIQEDHCMAQARKQTLRVTQIQNRYATVSFAQGHRHGFWDGVFWLRDRLLEWEDLPAREAVHELDIERRSIYWPLFNEDPTINADCPGGHRTVLDRRGICDECGHDFTV